MRALYCTADTIGISSGGGIVTKNELMALKAVSDDVMVLSRKEIDPAVFKQPESPFLFDYFSLEQIKDRHFDLAHFYSGTFTQSIRWLKSKGTKVTYTIAAHDRKLSIEEFHRLGLEYPFHHISDDSLFRIYTEGQRMADVVIAPSNKSAEILKSDVGCKNVVVIPHGVDLPKKVAPIPEKFDVCYLGQCGPDKGLFYLIKSWAMLNYPDSKLILAGDGTETLEPFVRQVADKGQFALLGRVPDVADVYNACSVMVFPSVTEGFGVGILETMAYGRPVIVSEGAGASELVEDSFGFVVSIRDPGAIADKIEWFRQNRDKILEMGQKARRKARNYTWGKIREKYKKVFLELRENEGGNNMQDIRKLLPQEKLLCAIFGESIEPHRFKTDVEGVTLKQAIDAAIETIPKERYRSVIRTRFGLDDGHSKTLLEVGKVFNVTSERIRQLEARALRWLRHPSRSRALKKYIEEG